MKARRSLIVAAFVAVTAAHAEAPRQQPLPAVYQDECGSCHLAYPPDLLGAGDWRALLGGLARHFGSDASLEPARTKEIADFLSAHAGRRTSGGGEPRITTSDWFRREHRDGHDGLSAALWKSPAVGSPANCAACHRQAAAGDFSERNLRLPGRPAQHERGD